MITARSQPCRAKRVTQGTLLLATSLACLPLPASGRDAFGPFLDSPIPLDIDRGRQESVLDRPRPEYEPDGVILGGFTVFPEVQTGVGVTSNVFAAEEDGETAAFLTLDPKVRARSNWLRHGLSVSMAGAFRRFLDRSIRNEDGLAARVDGRLDVSSNLVIDAAAAISREYQSQYSSEVPANTIAPIRYEKQTALMRATYGAGRMRAIVAGDVNRLDFRDATAGNVTIDQDFRDRTVNRLTARLEYAALSDVWLFTELSGSGIDHRIDRIGNASDNRDGAEYRALAGTSFDITALARARIGIGFIKRNFDSQSFRDLSGFAYDGRIEFFPSGLTTVSIAAQRRIGESIAAGSSGFYSNDYLARVDHELLRNLLLFGQARYQHNSFRGSDRRDDIWILESGASYLIDRSFSISAGLAYSDRSSSGLDRGQEFDEFRGLVAVRCAI